MPFITKDMLQLVSPDASQGTHTDEEEGEKRDGEDGQKEEHEEEMDKAQEGSVEKADPEGETTVHPSQQDSKETTGSWQQFLYLLFLVLLYLCWNSDDANACEEIIHLLVSLPYAPFRLSILILIVI